MESRKRKLPGRAARVDSENKKKRTSTPPEQRAQAAPRPPSPAPVVEDRLPKHITAGKPLPTVETPQSTNLSTREYQSIRESGVLQESLHRSRQKWISEGIFEKYWTKPTKRKGEKEPPNNPAKDTMTKLGTCSITVEPHVFEAVMYAVKDPNARQPLPPMPQQPMYRPIIQYGPPNGVMPPPQTPQPRAQPPPPQPQPQYPSTQPAQQPPTPASHSTPGKMPSPAPSATSTPGTNSTLKGNQTNGHPPNTSTQQHTPAPSNPPPSPAPSAKGTDPVIQMLAERAATDVELKALMRIVANGEATADELKKFQAHIDELTKLTLARQAAAQQPAPAPPPPPPTAQPQHALTKSPYPMHQPMPAKTAPIPPPVTHVQPQQQALRSKGPLPSSKPDICGIVFEFVGGSGDRFLFPKFSILEYLPRGEVIASFLIVRKGSATDSPKYDPQLDYYQPITIRLYTHQGRQLDSLAKVVAHPDEVRRYMDDIMENMTRAEYVLLAMQLPRESESAAAEDEKEKTPKIEQPPETNQVLWAASPNPAPITKLKPPKQMLTEEEQYQSFIATVS